MPPILQIAVVVVFCLMLPQLLTGVGLSGFVPGLIAALWAVVIGGLLHVRGWTTAPPISAAVQQVPGLLSALDFLTHGTAPRSLAAIDRKSLQQSIQDSIEAKLLGQEKAAGELGESVASALDSAVRPDRPRLVVIVGGPGSGRSTMLECVHNSTGSVAKAEILRRDSQRVITADDLAQYEVLLVDDVDQQSEGTRNAVADLLGRPGRTRLVVLVFRDKTRPKGPFEQPEPHTVNIDALLATVNRRSGDYAAPIVPRLPDREAMEEKARETLENHCSQHGLTLDVVASQEAIARAILKPWHEEKLAVHPGLWMRYLDLECERKLRQLRLAGCQRVKLAYVHALGTLELQRVS